MSDKVKKIEGKETNTVSHLKKNNSEITDVKEMSNVLADNFSKNSSSKHYSKKFQKHKKQSERERLKFKSNNKEDYNKPFRSENCAVSIALYLLMILVCVIAVKIWMS